MLVRIADYQTDARQNCDLFWSALGVASGDNDFGFGILPADTANCSASILIGTGGYGAGIQDND